MDSNHLQQIVTQRYSLFENKTTSIESAINFDPDFLAVVIQIFSNTEYFPKKELSQFSISIILDYLEKTHQLYLQKRLPEIEQTIRILRINYDKTHPCLLILDLFFTDYKIHLQKHISQEENTLFPYIKNLLKTMNNDISLYHSYCKIGQYCLFDFFEEHTDTEKDLLKVRQVIKKYEPSTTNQSPYRILLSQLKNLETDLHIHARIEEEILIPKAIQLEKSVKSLFITKVLQN